MNLAPPNPNFIQARDGILQADMINNSGANFIHNRVEELRLKDLFVPPNLRRVSIEKDLEEGVEKITNAEDVLQKSIGKH